MHNTVKTNSFILGDTDESQIKDARSHQYDYIKSFLDKVGVEMTNDPTLMSIPVSESALTTDELKSLPEFFCTQVPYTWKINVWKKKESIDRFWWRSKTFTSELIFSIDITEIQYETMCHDHSKIWIDNNAFSNGGFENK